ncbi:MAG: hypothetical protein JKY51_07440, partial [Opitutaceae bacterium]|nr:hypothetical protein [Opitutaceae bacterium]
ESAALNEVSLTSLTGRTFRGFLSGVINDQLSLKIITPQNEEVIYRFSPTEVSKLSFVDQESDLIIDELISLGNESAAIALLEEVTQNRLPYISFLNTSQRKTFLILTNLYLGSSQELKALRLAEILSRTLTDPISKKNLNDIILQCHFRLGEIDITTSLAREWCQQASLPTSSALGWNILASLAYDKEQWEEAIWIALHPITFSSYLPVAYLPKCYTIAIASYHEKDNTEMAEILFGEMLNRKLPWPEDKRFLALYSHYDLLLKTTLSKTKSPERGLTPDKPPEIEQNLSIDDVRKLISQPAS